MTVDDLLVKRLGALPVIAEYLERLRIRDCVDALVPMREVASRTHGEIVAALIANRLTAPQPLYRIVNWAETWAVEETLGIAPDELNDDRLGRCLDAIAAVHDQLRGAVTVEAVRACGLATKHLRWDLTSVAVTGEYPEEEQVAAYAQVRYGYGSSQKQVRYLEVTTADGGVPVWDQVHAGNTTDVATVIETMRSLQKHARCTDFVLIGDSKLLSAANRQALLTADLGYLAPLARTAELDAAFRAIPSQDLVPVDYVSARDQAKKPEERATYQAAERTVDLTLTDSTGRERTYHLRRVFIVSSQEQVACRRNRERQRARAEEEMARVCRQVGQRRYPTVTHAQAKIAAILERRHLRDLYRLTEGEDAGRPTLTWTLDPDALARAEALDGYYVLETPSPQTDIGTAALLALWKGQWQVEHRHRAAKGPLRIRPLFVTSNQRIVGLITILGLALLIFSLIEREARRALAPGEKVPDLLARQVAARPTGENILQALREISLATIVLGGERHRVVSALTPLHRTLLRLVSIPDATFLRLNGPLPRDHLVTCEIQA